MNDFIRLRQKYVNNKDHYAFAFVYLEKMLDKQANQKNDRLNQIKDIFQLIQNENAEVTHVIELLSYLSSNEYTNALIKSFLIENQSLFLNTAVKREVRRILSNQNTSESVCYTLIDSCIECKSAIINNEILHQLLNKEILHLNTFSLIIDYLHHFKVEGFEDSIYEWLSKEYPTVIKIQLIDLLVELYSVEMLSNLAFKSFLLSTNDCLSLENYIKNLKRNDTCLEEGLVILQSMFHGDFENSGKGNNGGLGIFLKSLGDELSKAEKIKKIISLTVTDSWSPKQSVLKDFSKKHTLMTIPIYLTPTKSVDLLIKEYLIKRTIRRFLKRSQLNPDIFHIRFLDNASMAIANLCKEQKKKLVLTLTPDPHRNMTNQKGMLYPFNVTEVAEKLNKIVIGDELLMMSDKLVGIGNQVVKKELEMFFPQLLSEINHNKIYMISEGIQTDINLIKKDEKSLTKKELEEMNLSENFLENPIILNVGRLNKLKAQDQLLKAWGDSKLSTVYNLLIVGGDIQHPNPEEKEMLDAFNMYLDANQHLKNNFIHLGALSNYQVRKFEKKIRAAQNTYPQVYLCSSQKEEFGIAILEALSQRMLVLGPNKGGVKSYLNNNVNGFLIDTTNSQSIAKDAEQIILSLKDQTKIFESIQENGAETVKERFSLPIIAKDFLTLYLSSEEE